MLETQTRAEEKFCKQTSLHEVDKMNIPDICQHESSLLRQKSLDKENKISSDDNSDAEIKSCVLSEDERSRLLLSEERINQVTSQALLVRRNSLRLVSRSPKLSRRATPIAELDRKWALNQCEELTTWVNSLLAQKDATLETDLKKSMSDGQTLPLLVSVISSDFEVASGPAKNRQEQFERTRSCLGHLKKLGYCTEVSALEIVNGDLKSVILLLSGLKNFAEQQQKSNAEEMKPSVTPRQGANMPTVNSNGGQGNGVKESSVSERLRRILKEPRSPGINVDSGEQDTNTIREQPVGESDSAASPTSHHGDHFHNYYGSQKGRPRQQQGQSIQNQRNQRQPVVSQQQQQHPASKSTHEQLPSHVAPQRQQQQSRYQRTDASHQQAEVSQTFPYSRRNQNPGLYNNSVPNLHSSRVDRGVTQPPRSMTPTPSGNKLSVYPGNVSKTHNAQMEMYPASVQPRSRTPHSQRREIQPSPTQRVYETIDEVKGQQANLPEYILRGVERRPTNSQQHSSDDPGVALAPDAQYETSARRASMPPTYHQTNSQYTAVNKRSNVQLEKGTDSEDEYVDISDDEEQTSNGEAGSATPPLPELNDDLPPLDQLSYKYQRSLSAGPKLLSAGVRSFQQKMASANENVPEEIDEDEEVGMAKEIHLVNKPEKSGRETPQPVSHAEVQYRRPSHQRSSNRETWKGRRRGDDCEERQYNRDSDGHLDHKVYRLERLYEDMSNYLHSTKQRHRDTRRHSIASASSSQYSYSHRHRKSRSPSDARTIQKRFHRLEAHIVTLAKSVAHLSTEVSTQNSIFNEIDRISNELELVKKRLPSGSHDKQSTPSHTNEQGEANPQKLSKLTRLKSSIKRRFFGQEPPLMRMFLKQLGYEKYEPMFEAEKIGVVELSYMSEERLRTIGIPLGPRVRILQEASRLCLSSQTPTTPNATLGRTKNNNR